MANDLYRELLGISDENRPLDCYQLLRLKRFEDDRFKAFANFRKLNRHVAEHATGDRVAVMDELSTELAKALITVTDSRSRSEYDQSLGRAEVADPKPQAVEQVLYRRKLASKEQLQEAAKYADAVGVELADALVQKKVVSADVAMQATAVAHGQAFVDVDEIPLDPAVIVSLPALFCRQNSLVPMFRMDDTVVVATPRQPSSEVEHELTMRLGKPAKIALCTPAAVNAVIDEHYTRETAEAERRSGRHLAGAKAGGLKEIKSGKSKSGGSGKQLSAEDAQKLRIMIPLMGFTFTMILWQVSLSAMFGYPSFLVGLLLAAAVGGLAFGVVKVLGI